MTKRVLIAILISSVLLALIYHTSCNIDGIYDFYSKNIRSSLFTAFLTLGSFLLSLKTFIVIKLKENIFDTESYKKRLTERRKLNPRLSLYGPVKRLSTLIFVTIISSLVASVSQLTVGLIEHWVASFVCIFLAIFALSMVVSTLLLIKRTLDNWLDYLEEDNNVFNQ